MWVVETSNFYFSSCFLPRKDSHKASTLRQTKHRLFFFGQVTQKCALLYSAVRGRLFGTMPEAVPFLSQSLPTTFL